MFFGVRDGISDAGVRSGFLKARGAWDLPWYARLRSREAGTVGGRRRQEGGMTADEFDRIFPLLQAQYGERRMRVVSA